MEVRPEGHLEDHLVILQEVQTEVRPEGHLEGRLVILQEVQTEVRPEGHLEVRSVKHSIQLHPLKHLQPRNQAFRCH